MSPSVPLFSTVILNTASSPTATVCVSFPIEPSVSTFGLLSSFVILILGHSTTTTDVSSSSTGFPVSGSSASTDAVFVYPSVVLACSQVYVNDSPGFNTSSPFPFTVNQLNVDGTVDGSVTCPPQFGASVSVITMFVRSDVPVFLTVILNTALAPDATVCVSSAPPSLSSGFASDLIISMFGPESNTSESS